MATLWFRDLRELIAVLKKYDVDVVTYYSREAFMPADQPQYFRHFIQTTVSAQLPMNNAAPVTVVWRVTHDIGTTSGHVAPPPELLFEKDAESLQPHERAWRDVETARVRVRSRLASVAALVRDHFPTVTEAMFDLEIPGVITEDVARYGSQTPKDDTEASKDADAPKLDEPADADS